MPNTTTKKKRSAVKPGAKPQRKKPTAKKSAKGTTPQSPTCPDTVKAEIEACLAGAPTEDAGADSINAWLFTSQNSVAVRVCRILEDKAARKLLTEAAGRTWKLVTDPKGKVLRLWARLNSELIRVAKSDAKALQRKVDHAPDGVFAGLFSPKHTYEDAAAILWDRTQGPVAIKADLIFPYHLIWELLPIDRLMWNWVKLPHADRLALRCPPAGEPTQAWPMPAMGDFVAPLVLNRLGMVADLTWHLRILAGAGAEDVDIEANWLHELRAELRAVRSEIWDVPNAQGRAGAMALLQTYLALETWQPGFEADWSVVPWPTQPAFAAFYIMDRSEDVPKASDMPDALRRTRRYALGDTFKEALEKRPGELARTVKAGLTWLAELRSADELDGTDARPDAFGRVSWNRDDPDYLPLSDAISELADGAIPVKLLGKIVRRKNVDMRWMNKGRRTNVHVGDFIRWWKRQPKTDAELDAILDGVDDRKQTEHEKKIAREGSQ